MQKLYSTERWRAFRKLVLAHRPRCEITGCPRPATNLDHIVPIASGGETWAERNLQALCQTCHSRKTAATDGGFGNQRRPGHAVQHGGFWPDGSPMHPTKYDPRPAQRTTKGKGNDR